MAKPVVHLCFDKLDRATGESEEISLSLPEGKFRALLTGDITYSGVVYLIEMQRLIGHHLWQSLWTLKHKLFEANYQLLTDALFLLIIYVTDSWVKHIFG